MLRVGALQAIIHTKNIALFLTLMTWAETIAAQNVAIDARQIVVKDVRQIIGTIVQSCIGNGRIQVVSPDGTDIFLRSLNVRGNVQFKLGKSSVMELVKSIDNTLAQDHIDKVRVCLLPVRQALLNTRLEATADRPVVPAVSAPPISASSSSGPRPSPPGPASTSVSLLAPPIPTSGSGPRPSPPGPASSSEPLPAPPILVSGSGPRPSPPGPASSSQSQPAPPVPASTAGPRPTPPG